MSVVGLLVPLDHSCQKQEAQFVSIFTTYLHQSTLLGTILFLLFCVVLFEVISLFISCWSSGE